jgi:hypothetical protein
MKELALKHGRVALVDDEDYERCIKHKWHLTAAGYVKKGRGGGVFFVKGHRYEYPAVTLHRFVLHKEIPTTLDIDHIDGNPLNNQKSNLRVMTRSAHTRRHRREE